jgi:hypothetical protein
MRLSSSPTLILAHVTIGHGQPPEEITMANGIERAVVGSALLCLASTSFANAGPLPSNRNIDIAVSNDAGALYGDGPDTYFINAPGGGLNQLHISTDSTSAGVSGQVTTQTVNASSMSGTFWITTTGGRGYNDDLILLFSLQGPIADNFSLNIKSSGYQWMPSAAGVVNPTYKDGAVNETFTKADFLYGPQTAKPGPGTGWVLPFYSGQNINDPSTGQSLMFVDLGVGNDNIRSAIDSGDAKVQFDISGVYDTTVAFNAYAWAFSAMVADSSINWTNNLSTDPNAPGQSGFSITTTAAPVPEPSAILLLGGSLAALAFARLRAKA